MAYVQFDINVELCTSRLAGAPQLIDSSHIVDAHTDSGARIAGRQLSEAQRFAIAYDFIRDQYVDNAACQKWLRLRRFLTADTDRARRNLAARDLNAFMAFGVRTHGHAVSFDSAHQSQQIRFEPVKIENQRRCVDIHQRVADAGRNPAGTHTHKCIDEGP
jgi:hypothetical protein